MTFKMEVDMDNAAFEERPASELGRLLRQAARKIEQGADGGKLMDINGNSVGRWEVTNGA